VSGERRFLDAGLAATAWIMTTVKTEGDTCAAFQYEPDGTERFPLGWCPRAAGARLALPPARAHDCLKPNGEAGYGGGPSRPDERNPRAQGTGILGQRRQGAADLLASQSSSSTCTVSRVTPTTSPSPYALSTIFLERTISDTTGMRWSNYEHRVVEAEPGPRNHLPAGAPGIGSTLLRLHRHLAGDPWTVRWPHAPSWAPERGS